MLVSVELTIATLFGAPTVFRPSRRKLNVIGFSLRCVGGCKAAAGDISVRATFEAPTDLTERVCHGFTSAVYAIRAMRQGTTRLKLRFAEPATTASVNEDVVTAHFRG